MSGLHDYLTLTEVSKRYGVSRTRIWQLIKEGRMPAEMFGGRWIIKQTDLEALEARKEEGSV